MPDAICHILRSKRGSIHHETISRNDTGIEWQQINATVRRNVQMIDNDSKQWLLGRDEAFSGCLLEQIGER